MSAVQNERRDHLSLVTGSVVTGQSSMVLESFPRYHLVLNAMSLHGSDEGFTVISRYGLAVAYPTRNFATLGPFVLLRPLRAVGLATHSAYCYAGRTISSSSGLPFDVWRIVSEDSLTRARIS